MDGKDEVTGLNGMGGMEGADGMSGNGGMEGVAGVSGGGGMSRNEDAQPAQQPTQSAAGANPASADLAEKLERWEELGRKSFWGYLGCRLEQWNDRQVTASLEIRPELLNLGGILHGGVHASLIDSTMGMLIMIALGEENIVTTNLNMHFLASRSEGRVYATAEIVHRARRTVTAEAIVRAEDGERLAFGTATFLLVGQKTNA